MKIIAGGMIGVALFAVGISGCVSTNATMLGPTRMRASVHPESVMLYRTAAQVPGQYEEVALLHSKGDASMTSEPAMFASMRSKAAEVGANGIIMDAISEPSAGAKIAGAFLGYSAERQGKAVAIYVYSMAQEPFVSMTPPPPAIQSFAPAASPPPRPQSQQRVDPLQALDRLWQQGQITPEEYWRQRDAIVPSERTVPPPRPQPATLYQQSVPLATEIIVPPVALAPSQNGMRALLDEWKQGTITIEEYQRRREALAGE